MLQNMIVLSNKTKKASMSGKNEDITNLIKICNLGISRRHTFFAKRYILRVHPANEFRNIIKLICQHNVTKTYYRK